MKENAIDEMNRCEECSAPGELHQFKERVGSNYRRLCSECFELGLDEIFDVVGRHQGGRGSIFVCSLCDTLGMSLRQPSGVSLCRNCYSEYDRSMETVKVRFNQRQEESTARIAAMSDAERGELYSKFESWGMP